MRLDPSPDSDILIAAKAARNANELVVIVASVNGMFRTVQRQFARYNEDTALSSYYETIRKCLELGRDLRGLYAAGSALTDSKRDRCLEAVKTVRQGLQKIINEATDRVSALVEQAIPERIAKYSELIARKFKSRALSLKVVNFHDGETGYRTLVFNGIELNSGYTSAEVIVKLREGPMGIHVCFPATLFSEADYYPVSTVQMLSAILGEVLSPKGTTPNSSVSRIEAQDCVKFVDVSDTLDVHIYGNATAQEINNLLRISVPMLRRAVGSGSLDVLHKMEVDAYGERVLRFLVAEKPVVDAAAMARLRRTLGISAKSNNELKELMGEE